MARLIHAPIDGMATPRDGDVMLNKYWCVHPEKGIAFWDRGGRGSFDRERLSPQCNADRRVSDILVGIHEGHVVQQIPAVYLGNLARVFSKPTPPQ